ncbi:hypothetical protein ScPMuIL_011814 [Solemya velum]
MQFIWCAVLLCVTVSAVVGLDVSVPKMAGRRRRVKACRYTKGDWSECDEATQMMTRTLTLKRGDPASCEETKQVSFSCKKVERKLRKKACKYNKGTWGECDPSTNQRSRILTLRKGDASQCEATKTITRKCKNPLRKQRKSKLAASKAAKGCKYQLGEWTECDEKTNTRSRTLELRSGDTTLCQAVKIFYRKCKRPCRFKKGQWSECDETHLMERVDTLVGQSNDFCDATRKITKKCGKGKPGGGHKKAGKCKYQLGDWSECNPSTQLRTRVKSLVSGDLSLCQDEKVFNRSCARPNGKERCFFGEWGDYAPCQNGVMKKQRQVLQGGIECQRRGVKTKPCDAAEDVEPQLFRDSKPISNF